MKKLPGEGGYYVETYRSAEKIPRSALPKRYPADRSFASCILYLLTAEAFSAIHRIKSDEVFHFYLGDPVTMLKLFPDAGSEVVTLGTDILNGQVIQTIVPALCWQGCRLVPGGKFALLGTTVAPAFEFEDFELADRNKLLPAYPSQQELIRQLTR